MAAGIAQQPLPAEHVLNRIAAHQVNLKTPLRWYRRLRSDPARLLRGYRLELDLGGVESAEGFLPVRGVMRLGFTPKEEDPALPDVRGG